MAVDKRIAELISADIDGEISDTEHQELQNQLQTQPEAQQLFNEMASLCESLDSMSSVSPPPHLKHIILDSIQQPSPTHHAVKPSWRSLLMGPTIRYASMFAAGSVVTFLIISSNQISERAFDDVTELVGTMTTEVNGTGHPGDNTINLTAQNLAGTVKAQRAGPIMVIDFDLTSIEPVEIIASFEDRDIWFNGFAQLEGGGTTVSAETGRVSMRMTGKRRYAMYLHNASGGAAVVKLQFFAADKLIYEDELIFGGSN